MNFFYEEEILLTKHDVKNEFINERNRRFLKLYCNDGIEDVVFLNNHPFIKRVELGKKCFEQIYETKLIYVTHISISYEEHWVSKELMLTKFLEINDQINSLECMGQFYDVNDNFKKVISRLNYYVNYTTHVKWGTKTKKDLEFEFENLNNLKIKNYNDIKDAQQYKNVKQLKIDAIQVFVDLSKKKLDLSKLELPATLEYLKMYCDTKQLNLIFKKIKDQNIKLKKINFSYEKDNVIDYDIFKELTTLEISSSYKFSIYKMVSPLKNLRFLKLQIREMNMYNNMELVRLLDETPNLIIILCVICVYTNADRVVNKILTMAKLMNLNYISYNNIIYLMNNSYKLSFQHYDFKFKYFFKYNININYLE